MRRYTAIVSGGMDSTVLAYDIDAHQELARIVSFDYGQRHVKELEFAGETARALSVEHHVIVLPRTIFNAGASALVNPEVPVPEGHYAEASMAATVVPNRNMVMLAMASSLAIGHGDNGVATAVHAGDHFIYPDCRPEFIQAMTRALRLGNAGFAVDEFEVLAPYVHASKADLAQHGDRLHVPWRSTWSCYVGGEIHCGACGTCFERREAFTLGLVDDPTEYAATPSFADPNA